MRDCSVQVLERWRKDKWCGLFEKPSTPVVQCMTHVIANKILG